MLAPHDRRLLLDALRPPAGYRLDRAIGTTFSLDLLALLTAPLAFTFLDWEDQAGRPTSDPIALLEAIRRHAGRISIFCEAGKIRVPAHGQLLFGYLEDSVFEVVAPKPGGIFHPKIWVVRYNADDQPIRYRFLCLSRNLTFDRSWDTALVLDGELVDRDRAFAANHPLGDFIETLPRLAKLPVSRAVAKAVREVADEVRRVRFDMPEGVAAIGFWPLGIEGGGSLPFPRDNRRMLVMSPFLSEGFLKRVAADHPQSLLISRPDALQAISKDTLGLFAEVHVLSPDLEPEEEGSQQESSGSEFADSPPSGLHAKLFVEDDGWTGRVWTGSANATDAAFNQNVELLVELVGRKKSLGVDAFLGDEDGFASGIRDLLQPFHRVEDAAPTPDPLGDALEELRRDLSRCLFRADVAADAGAETFTVTLTAAAELPSWAKEVSVTCRPSTLKSEHACALVPGSKPSALFASISFEALTSFFVFDLTFQQAGKSASISFAINTPLHGAPVDRRERLLRALLRNRDQVLRLLLLLLAEGEVSVSDLTGAINGSSPDGKPRPSPQSDLFPLLEPLLRALARDPRRIDEAALLIEDLRRTPEGKALLPEGLEAIWEPIWASRAGIAK